MKQSIPGRLVRRLAALGLCLTMACTAIPFAGAVSQSDIDALESQKADLNSQMSSVQSQIDDLEDQQDTALQQALLYQQQLGLLTQQVNDTQAVIDDYEVQIADTQVQLEQAQAEAESYYQLFCQRVRDTEETGSVSYWSILFDAASFSDLLDRINFVKDVVNYDNSVVDALEAARQQVADTEAQLEQEKAAQETALAELEDQQAAIQDASDKNEALLAEIQANQAVYADQLAQLEAESDDLDGIIVLTKEQYAAEQAEAQRKAQEEAQRKQEEEEARKQQAANNSSNSGSSSSDSSSSGSSSNSSGSSSSSSSSSSSGSGSDVVDYAMQFVGNPYVWGGTSLTNGCDCSGFTMQVYAHFGVRLSHSSWAQSSSGTRVSASEAQPGDLIFYQSSGSATGGHVGIYIGGGKMVSALSSKYGICVSTVNYDKTGLTFRRVL